MRFRCTVSQIGTLNILESEAWRAELRKHAGKEVWLEIKSEKEQRSSQANKYWWGVIVQFYQDVWSLNRPATLTKDQAHDVLVRVLYGTEPGPMGQTIRRETKGMDTKEFAEMVDKARALALQQYGSHVPGPGEHWEDE